MSRIHPVPGYPDSENMWEKLWNLEKPDALVTKYPNSRSEFLFQVNDSRQFKIKKNPLYKRVAREVREQQKNAGNHHGQTASGDAGSTTGSNSTNL
jgi:hypothetical protein